MLDRDQLLQQVLALGPDDRAIVASALERSLQQECFANPEVAAAWTAELERRALAVERGDVETEDWQTVVERIRNPPSLINRPN